MRKPHRHAELIKAWADGAEIQVYDTHNEVWRNSPTPIWDSGLKYRIFVEPKPDFVYYGVFEMNGSMIMESCFTKLNHDNDQLKLTFDGETGKLKSAEVL